MLLSSKMEKKERKEKGNKLPECLSSVAHFFPFQY